MASMTEARANAIAIFCRRFEPDGDGFMFRDTVKTDAFRVTAAEREEFLRRFKRGYRLATWGLVGAMVAFCGVALAITLTVQLREGAKGALFLAALLAPVLPFHLVMRHLWSAPVRALGGRLPAAPAYSPDEARRRGLAHVDISKAAPFLLVFPFLIWSQTKGRPFEGWNWVWTILFGAVTVLIVVQAIRKWRATGRL